MRPLGVNTRIADVEIEEVKLVYDECKSYAETGRALNISAGTVSRIIRKLGRFHPLA